MKKILVIEDDLDTMDIVDYLLKKGGYLVEMISDFITPEDIARINPDLMIIDCLLPFGLGNELCLEIKNHEATKHIPVILYSTSHNLKEIAGSCKADAFVAKPFDIDHILNEVNRLVS
jgi:DNA-binding response OmpR family regulator